MAQLALRKEDHPEWTRSDNPSKGTGLEEGDTRCGYLHFNCGDSTLLVLKMEGGWGREHDHSKSPSHLWGSWKQSPWSYNHKALNCTNIQ